MYNQKYRILSTIALSFGYLTTISYIHPKYIATILVLDMVYLIVHSELHTLHKNKLYANYLHTLHDIILSNKKNIYYMILNLFLNSVIQISMFVMWQKINIWYSDDKSIESIRCIYGLLGMKLLFACFNNKQYFNIEKTISLPLKSLVHHYFITHIYDSDPYNLDQCTHSEIILARDKLLESMRSVPENVIHMINHGLKLTIHYILLYMYYYDICIYTIAIHYGFFRLFGFDEILRVQNKQRKLNDDNDDFQLKLDNIYHDYNLHVMQNSGKYADTASDHVKEISDTEIKNQLNVSIEWSDYYDLYNMIYQLHDFGVLFIYCLFHYENLSFANMFIVTSGPGAWCIDYIIRSIQECLPKISKFQTYLKLQDKLQKSHDKMVNVVYENHDFIINKIHLIPSGTYRLTGPVGAGKTTILRELAFAYPEQRDRVCYLPQRNLCIYDKKKLEDCIIGIYPKHISLLTKVLKIVPMKYKLDDLLSKPSGGETQLIHIAKLMYIALLKENTKWIFLDEYDNNLDQDIQDTILHNIRNAFPHVVILYTSHKTNTLETINISV